MARTEKEQRHLDNIRLLDKSFWHGQWWEKGKPNPRSPLNEGIIFQYQEKVDKKSKHQSK